MGGTVFGMPMTTVLWILGVPAVVTIILVWWGITYQPRETDDLLFKKEGR